jgi:hypothetical protein
LALPPVRLWPGVKVAKARARPASLTVRPAKPLRRDEFTIIPELAANLFFMEDLPVSYSLLVATLLMSNRQMISIHIVRVTTYAEFQTEK